MALSLNNPRRLHFDPRPPESFDQNPIQIILCGHVIHALPIRQEVSLFGPCPTASTVDMSYKWALQTILPKISQFIDDPAMLSLA